MFSGADSEINVGHHKLDSLIHQFNHRAFINLIGEDRLSDFCPMKMGALDPGRYQKPLGLLCE